jgi:hypothetical protein
LINAGFPPQPVWFCCRCLHEKGRGFGVRYLMVLLSLLPTCALAQELSVEDRACITAAAGKLPTIAVLEIKGSRALVRPVQERRNQKLHNAIVEIDVGVAGHSST